MARGPVADFSAVGRYGDAPLTVTFTDESSAGDMPITDWAWTFGDGETSEEQSPEHEYAAGGNYTVGLTVTTDVGSNTKTKTDFVVAVLEGTGPMGIPLSKLRELIGASDTFQTWVGADDDAEGRARVYVGMNAEEDLERPFALVWPAEILKTVIATGGVATCTGKLVAWFEGEVPELYRASANATLWFANLVGAILNDMVAGGDAAGWAIRSWRTMIGPVRADNEERRDVGDVVRCGIEIDFGVD
jgi:PKD repeat protein